MVLFLRLSVFFFFFFCCSCLQSVNECNIILRRVFRKKKEEKKSASTSSSPSTKFINLCQKLKRNGSAKKKIRKKAKKRKCIRRKRHMKGERGTFLPRLENQVKMVFITKDAAGTIIMIFSLSYFVFIL